MHALRQQIAAAEDLLKRFRAYAVSIGCNAYVRDSFVADDKQAELLAKWWEENARKTLS